MSDLDALKLLYKDSAFWRLVYRGDGIAGVFASTQLVLNKTLNQTISAANSSASARDGSFKMVL
jgi:hypothetical protein